MMGIHGSTVGQIIRREKSYSHPLEVLLEHLEREAEDDPFLAACARILREGSERTVRGFLMNIVAILGEVPGAQDQVEELRRIEENYLQKRRDEGAAEEAQREDRGRAAGPG
jgi:hypothetical protein